VRNGLRRRYGSAAMAVAALLLLAGSAGGSAAASAPVVYAASSAPVRVAVPFPQTWIFPIWNVGEGVANEDVLQSWLPLYWFGQSGRAAVNPALSVADLPVYSNAGRTATITLKRGYTWSNGSAVTTRDIRLWMNLLTQSDKQYPANWVGYTPTGFPFNITNITYASARTFAITFNRAYNHNWVLYNELAQIFPIPQYAWDKTSAAGQIGNYDETQTGVPAVLNYLNSASASLTTWAKDPLWQAVDGQYRLLSYDATTGNETFVRNARYTGAAKATVEKYELVPYTSNSSEFAALLTGSVDYGYVPLTDLNAESRLKAEGFKISPWYLFGFGELYPNLSNPTVGAILRQLYVRQAMQHLINQKEFVSKIFHGNAAPTYGPVPTAVSNSFASSFEKSDPYPYSVTDATGLLTAHGWTVSAGGVSTCRRAGTSATECGAGVAKGAALEFTLLYAAGATQVGDEAAAMQTDFSLAGMKLILKAAPSDQLYGQLTPCTGSSGAGCSWDLIDTGGGWVYSSPNFYPSGEAMFATGSGSDSNGYSNATADSLIKAVEVDNGPDALNAYQNFIAKDLPVLYLPWEVNQVSAISGKLKGALPQDPYQQIYPQYWRVKG
jgi:peptide/nickel transport system substrate-binding protein